MGDEGAGLLGICFLREAPERAIGTDRRARKWGLARTFFENFLLNDELTNLAFQAGGLRFALFDALAGGVHTLEKLEKLAHALLQLLFPSADLGGGDIFVDGDLLDGFL